MAEKPIDRQVGVHHEDRDINGRDSVQLDHPTRVDALSTQVDMGHFGHPDLNVNISYYNYTDQGIYATDRLGCVTFLPARGHRWKGRPSLVIEIQYTLTACAEFDPNYLIDMAGQNTMMEKALTALRNDLHNQYYNGPTHIGPVRRSVVLRLETVQSTLEEGGGVLYLRDLDLHLVLKKAYEGPEDTLHPYSRQAGPWAIENRHRQFHQKMREFSILYIDNRRSASRQGFWMNFMGTPTYIPAETSDFLHTGVYVCTSMGDIPRNARYYKPNVYYYPDIASAQADYALYHTEVEARAYGDPNKVKEQEHKDKEFEIRWEELNQREQKVKHEEEKQHKEREQQKRSNRYRTIREIVAVVTAGIGLAAAIAKRK